MANEAMEATWNGEEGAQWAAAADKYDAASVRIGEALREHLALRPADAVLDVGCGAGGLSLDLAQQRPEGSVLGVDLSSQMLEVAAARAAARGLSNVRFERADAQTHPFDVASFDAAVSIMGVMFFDDPATAFANVARALKLDATATFAVWRPLTENEWLTGIRAALAMGRDLPSPPADGPSPFSLSDPERTTRLLEVAGFASIQFTPVDPPMVLGVDVDGAMEFAAQMGPVKGLMDPLDDGQRVEALANLRQLLVDHQTSDGVLVNTAVWIITARKRGS